MKNRDFNTVSKTENASADANFGRCDLRHSLVPPESACPLGSTDRQFPPTYVKYNTSQDLIGIPQWAVIAPARAPFRLMEPIAGCFRCHILPHPEPFCFQHKFHKYNKAPFNPHPGGYFA